ncbi:MAG TPA: CDP-archaeol synthase [Gemmatimonadales bacterium]
MASSLPRRVGVAAVGIPLAFGLVYLGEWPLVIALQGLALLGTAELYRLAAPLGVRALAVSGLLGAVLAPVVLWGLVEGNGLVTTWGGYAAILWLLATLAAAVWRRAPDERPLDAAAITVLGVLYAALLPSFVVVLRHTVPDAPPWPATWLVFLPLAITWICDSMAMAGGALIGGAQCAPVISPNKTWAGTVTGSLSAVVAAILYGMLVLDRVGTHLPWWQLATMGLVLSVVGQLGDLAESLFKRAAGVKDSGTVFPGHGGVLDRLDSLYWVLPISALMLTVFGVL